MMYGVLVNFFTFFSLQRINRTSLMIHKEKKLSSKEGEPYTQRKNKFSNDESI